MAKVTIKASENGPYIVEVDGQTKAALCRCGASNSKPNCDGTHSKVGFKAGSSELNVTE
ncbi:MAG: CDGSH iron-sulfur domain-containing protein [Nitrosopumilaceae archaeon]|nr:CDGSH iron-sulfur domain-containing protein [Nitrosopumilaceae archaeon]NIU00060.1 CDGSH iron-sulfur domain-containing protein [Nitrosopumilaceae archaeon]NIU86439.1 CDGSH iron-sulfur domain-containing protein [Nitrosopumilaceae archaeon]NIV65148.1 CDGSH iron-sulfur domain-containing protein [Nitrosopumilaceae archaeon]NIX60662.1 CDGSH iron-sulfur domain-containing protein [Nitrosopumilaceae archaeon]